MTGRDLIGEWQHAARTARGWRRLLLAFAAGGLSNLAMAPFFFAPILFLTLPVLVWLLDEAASRPGTRRDVARAAASAGWWFAFGYFQFGLFWIGEAFLVEADKFGWLIPFALTLLPAGLALFWAAAAAVAALFWRPGLARILVLAVALGCTEWLRGHILTGFPWNVPGYALTWPLVLMQGAGLVGIYGLTLVVVPVFAAPLALAADHARGPLRRRAWMRALAVSGLPLLLLLVYGAARLASAPEGWVEGVKLRVVQPSVPQTDKWRPDKQAAIFADHLALSKQDDTGRADDLAGITHLVWPEAAMPFFPLEHPEALSAIGTLLPDGVFLLTGALRREGTWEGKILDVLPRAFNSLMVLDDTGALVDLYDKTHLVPFGEYLPLQRTLESIGLESLTRQRGGFSIGVTPRPLLLAPGLPPVGGLICYEAIFPGVGAASAGRPGVLVNVTNDGWFGNTTGPRQHFHEARVRAVEEGLPLIRAANNGISAVVDPSGRVLGLLGINARGVIDSRLPLSRSAPPYALAGDLLFLLLGAGLAVAVLVLDWAGRRRGRGRSPTA
ncbi:MAG: apolipoprotein N-acyltransferase [Hyphomicrobium sp.]|uniref:apolipoprotein N-acyltransferase n=1 Tax=Hyphomicrobium sp. TaxID=82 RepID=UPI003D117539